MIPKVLAVFAHRPDKISKALSYTDINHHVVVPTIINKWAETTIVANTTMHIPENVKYMLHIPYHWKMFRLAKKGKYNVLISHGGIVGFWTWVLARVTGSKFVMRLGGHIYEEADEHTVTRPKLESRAYGIHFRLAFWNLSRADQIIVVTDDMRRRLEERNRKTKGKISVVPVPCHINNDNGKVEHSGINLLTIVNLNFMAKVDALKEFMPAIFNVLAHRKEAIYRLVAPGRYADNLKQWLMETCPAEVMDRVIISGFIDDVGSEYRKADIFCYFSNLDGCPNVILEAWSYRLPVVANRCSWSNEVIDNYVTGFLANDTEHAESLIESFINPDTNRVNGLAEKISGNAYRELTGKHTNELVGSRLQEVLYKVAK